jgi:nucleolin
VAYFDGCPNLCCLLNRGGRFLKIEKCKLKPRAAAKDPERGEVQKTPGSTSAYIGNLSWDVTEDVIKNYFKKSYSDSKIDSIRLAFDKDTGDFKGFGHVDFGDDESLEEAVKLNQTPLLGRPMKVAYSVPPKKSFAQAGNRNSNESRSAGTCYNCGEDGHKAFLCPKKGTNADGKFDSKKVAACYSCGEEGHKSFRCPKKNST